jgi:hypothetical protein
MQILAVSYPKWLVEALDRPRTKDRTPVLKVWLDVWCVVRVEERREDGTTKAKQRKRRQAEAARG